MGTKDPFGGESTRITSSAQIDEMLKQAQSSASFDDADDVDDFEERTQIGNVAELAARSMAIEDPTPPPPVVSRSSTNVIRRNTPLPMSAVRPPSASESTPMPRAQGSLNEMTPPPVAPTDDVAFDPWDEPPVQTISQPMQAVMVESLPLPPPPIAEAPSVYAPPAAVVHVEPRKPKWGLVAWVALLAVFATVCTLGYMRIVQLEEQLAQARAQQ